MMREAAVAPEPFQSRLLVVDDDPAFGRLVKRVAEPCGYEVALADPVGCRDLATSWHPSIIILDLQMPRVDGIEVLRYLSADRCTAQIFVASGGVDSRTLDAVVRLGGERGLNMGGALPKPVRIQELREVLTTARAGARELSPEELAAAIDADQLFLEYQPKLDCRRRAITAVEALVRWRHPLKGVVVPDRFIPLAEQNDLIDSLTDWVVAVAINEAVGWHRRGFPLAVAVNVSGRNLRRIDLPDRIAERCERCEFAAEHLILELTESQAMADAVQAVDVLTRLRVKGCRLSIDDFGTGYSSLAQLHRVPFSEVKIDRSFVSGLLHDKDCRAIAETIVVLCRKIGLDCVAEGVESGEVLDALVRMGCDGAQGFYIGRPIAGDRVIDFVREFAAAPRYQERTAW
jgi:EAL domain-containing protein (putative c-di-GMP-specific phosphodiesterase class I)